MQVNIIKLRAHKFLKSLIVTGPFNKSCSMSNHVRLKLGTPRLPNTLTKRMKYCLQKHV